MLAVYTAAIFVSSTLLFLVQPMFAKMVLPLLGGTPAVWNTCMVFFQTMLLAGYAYAHVTTKLLGVRRQAMLHLLILLIPLIALPIAIPKGWAPPTETNPIPSLLLLLGVAVGLPFFALSTTNPLLQSWFSQTGHPAARDPYFLYAASNLGSMLALIAFPVGIEPFLPVAWQSKGWSIGYCVLIALIAACAWLLWKSPKSEAEPTLTNSYPDGEGESIGVRRRLRWIALAFAPSSLMIGVTTYITTDIASFPLLWIIPLAIYLLSFIIVFAKQPFWPHSLTKLAFPFVMVPLALLMAVSNSISDMQIIGLHLLGLFMVSMLCHGELAKDRPSPRHLTEFYLLMSLGGNLGGIFNALVAPVLFNSVVEYPIVVVVACLLLPKRNEAPSTPDQKKKDVLFPAALLAIVAALVLLTPAQQASGEPTWTEFYLRIFLYGIPALVCFAFSDRPLRFALAVGVILLIRPMKDRVDNPLVHIERSFFGVHKVMEGGSGPYGEFRRLLHGTTMHGMQKLDPTKACELSTYYHPTGPLGQIFGEFHGAVKTPRVALVGLGTGGLSSYREAGQEFDIYEIDPAVQRISDQSKYFTYLSECCAKAGKPGGYKIILGDGRLRLAEAPDHYYGIIVLDAFSSDAVPMHLMTREALALYDKKLAPGGVIAFHVSNRILNLPPVVAAIAKDAGMRPFLCEEGKEDLEPQEKDDQATKDRKTKAIDEGKFASSVVAVVRKPEELGGLIKTEKWVDILSMAKRRPWTDDFSNLLETIRW